MHLQITGLLTAGSNLAQGRSLCEKVFHFACSWFNDFLGTLRFPPPFLKWSFQYTWKNLGWGVKHSKNVSISLHMYNSFLDYMFLRTVWWFVLSSNNYLNDNVENKLSHSDGLVLIMVFNVKSKIFHLKWDDS